MRRVFVVMVAVLATVFVGAVSAAGNQVAVVFNGTTQVNRESYNFLKRNIGQLNPDVTLVPIQDAKSVKPGTYRAVVVMNTGLESGIDPVLKTLLDTYPDKKALFQVNILKGSTKTTIETIPAASNPEGVDAITSASTWTEDATKMTYVRMHQEWIKVLSDFLKARA